MSYHEKKGATIFLWSFMKENGNIKIFFSQFYLFMSRALIIKTCTLYQKWNDLFFIIVKFYVQWLGAYKCHKQPKTDIIGNFNISVKMNWVTGEICVRVPHLMNTYCSFSGLKVGESKRACFGSMVILVS